MATVSSSEFVRLSMIEDPGVFSVGTLPAHSDHISYASREEADRGQTSLRMSLNGLWRFHYARNITSAPDGFEQPDYDCSGWDEIRVPAHIQMEGYDVPAYVNYQYPWDGREELQPGEVPKEFNPTASYIRFFTLPRDWHCRPLRISFQGVESGFALWLNGQFVGYAEDSFTPSDFDLTAFVREGENRLAVQVYKWTSSSWLESQDFYRFSGIFRDVFLYTVPMLHVRDLKIRTLLNDSCDEAELAFDLQLEVTAAASATGNEEEDGRNSAAGETHCCRGGAQSGSGGLTAREETPGDCSGRARFAMVRWRLGRDGRTDAEGELPAGPSVIVREKINAPALWSAENPQLYDLQIELLVPAAGASQDGGLSTFVQTRPGTAEDRWIPAEVLRERVGFRRFEMKDGLMCLNGKRIVFKGVNRHEFTCDTGRAGMTDEILRDDLAIMKKANINAIRTSHYPNDSRLYRLCDEYGLYLIAENNMETHASWAAAEMTGRNREGILPGDHREWEPMLLDRVNSCYQRDKNHPCILIWSCGNESYGGPVIHAMSERFRELDPDRLVHYEGVFHDRTYNETSDMESQMYPSVPMIREYLAEHPDKPFICCEYTHSMGNSNGGMFLYTELAETEPRYQGGFIWDFCDQSLRRKDCYGVEYQAYGGDCGERPTDYSFSGNGIVAGDRMPYPKLQEVKYLYQNIRVLVERESFRVINRNLFVNTDQWDCVLILEREGEMLRRQMVQVSVPPMEEREFPLPFPVPDAEGEYAVTVSFCLKEDSVWARRGYEIAFGQGVFSSQTVSSPDTAAVQWVHDFPEKPLCGSGGGAAGLSAAQVRSGAGRPVLRVIRGDYNIGFQGEDYDALFSFLNGTGLKSYRYGGKEMIDLPPRPNFWRAPTDNDKGNRMPARYGIWKIAGLYAADVPAEGWTADRREEAGEYPLFRQEEDSFCVTQRYYLPTVPETELIVETRFHADGRVDFLMDYAPQADLPPMPEFGMLFTLDAAYDQVAWYGYGPEETTCDRQEGARLGLYRGTVKEQMTRYLVPQECGSRTGVRRARVTDHRGRGVEFSVPKGQTMTFSALPWTPDEVENAAHHTELPPIHHTIVRCALMQMGVGGDDSWGARTHDEFLLPCRERLHFEVSMRGV